MTDPTNEMYRHRHDTVCWDRGEGPAVVFSHGTLMDRTMFRPQVEELQDEYRVVAYDSRQRTDRWMGTYDLDDHARDCLALMDGLDIDSCVLAGMSMGGFMALRFALQYPERLDGLVLIDSMAMQHDEEEHETYGAMLDQVEGREAPPRPLAEVASDILFGNTTIEEQPGLVEQWIERWMTYPGDSIRNEVSSWLGRPDVTPRLPEIEVPALIVHGEEDAAIHPERAEPMLDGLPDARMVRVPDAGHSSNLENPSFVNRELKSFLGEVYG